jgi:hypothetical protein
MNLDVQQFAEALRKMLRKDMNDLADDLALNTCKNMEDYRHICGRINGLAVAEQYLIDLAHTQEEADE